MRAALGIVAGIIFILIAVSNSAHVTSQEGDVSTDNEKKNMSNKIAGFTTWEDPEGRFTVEHPSNWTIEEKSNRFENAELTAV